MIDSKGMLTVNNHRHFLHCGCRICGGTKLWCTPSINGYGRLENTCTCKSTMGIDSQVIPHTITLIYHMVTI